MFKIILYTMKPADMEKKLNEFATKYKIIDWQVLPSNDISPEKIYIEYENISDYHEPTNAELIQELAEDQRKNKQSHDKDVETQFQEWLEERR